MDLIKLMNQIKIDFPGNSINFLCITGKVNLAFFDIIVYYVPSLIVCRISLRLPVWIVQVQWY